MADVGLLATLALIVIVVTFVRPWLAVAAGGGITDTAMGAALIGLAAGRMAAVALDDPGALTQLSDLLIIRSGVEFWPGVLVGVAWLVARARREHVGSWDRLAALVPAGLVAWGVYEATCLVRGGCPGPVSGVGLHPDGLSNRVLPIGVVVGSFAVVGAVLLSVMQRRGLSSRRVVVAGVVAVAVIRSIASVWLPRIGDRLTRQHRTSLIVAGLGFVALAGELVGSKRAHHEPSAG